MSSKKETFENGLLDDRPLWERLPSRPVTAHEVAAILPEDRHVKVYGSFDCNDYSSDETTFERLLVEDDCFHYLAREGEDGGWCRVDTCGKGTGVHAKRPFSYWLARERARGFLSWPDENLTSAHGELGVCLWDIAEADGPDYRTVRLETGVIPLSDEEATRLVEEMEEELAETTVGTDTED